ncbi:MAG: hypothetical protein IJH69_01010 [Firmicutes bacterium]|nr:hypothetical protein [Bacillota bacterium]MBQ6607670.1 hypothetical protein [Bacillota bacterium]
MDHSAEERFIKNFIKKRYRERLLFELTTPKKRYAGLDRFCHQASDLIDPMRIYLEGDDLDRLSEFKDFCKKHQGLCRVLSPEFYWDEIEVPLDGAVEMAVTSLDAFLVLGDGFAIVFGEPVKGGREKYLVVENASK